MNTTTLQQSHRILFSIKNVLFGCYLAALLIMALFPPLYLSVSGSSMIILGIPLPIFYWLAIAILLSLGLWVIYMTECALGEIPAEGEEQ